MRVLWFSNTPAAGDEFISSDGTGGWLKSLDKAIQNRVELHVAFYDRRYPSEFTVGATTYHQIAPKNKLSLIKRRLLFFFRRKNPDIPRYLEVINLVKPDIIHIHGTEKPWIELIQYTDIPVILSIQAILTVMNYKYFSGISRKDVPLMSRYLSDYQGYLKEGAIERIYLKNLQYVLGRTDWDKRVYSLLSPRAKYFVCNEILRDGFYRSQWKWEMNHPGRYIIHTTTGTMLFKGLETICEAAEELERLGFQFEWRVAGISPESEIVGIVRKRLKHHLPESILLLGPLQEDKLIKKMLEADIYVNASHQDNSPNSLCEAMLLGMPCIATCAGGSNTILRDKETGILIQDGDPWALAGAILELFKNKENARNYALAAREDSLKRHDKTIIVNNLIAVYREIVSESLK